MIAQRAGLSGSAVSMALRNHPRISAVTRERVKRIARELGYRPDPDVAKLMNHLRLRQKPRRKFSIAALTTIPENEERPYNRKLIQGAIQRADALGYHLTIFRFDPGAKRNRSLQRILRSRGVEGLLLLPMRLAQPLTDLLDWEQFSVVAATRAVPAPEFHRVVPHHFINTLLVCEQLEQLGYRRIGLVTNREFDVSISPGLAAGVVWQSTQGRAEQVTPLFFEGERPSGVKAWFERERPDSIVVRGVPDAEAIVADLGLKFPGPIGVAATNLEGLTDFAGIDSQEFEIGGTAVDQLHARIQSNLKGVPRVPTETTIFGRWIAGPSVRATAPRQIRMVK
jgi:DNA-binding LacI/PurR family transcriptional regulator